MFHQKLVKFNRELRNSGIRSSGNQEGQLYLKKKVNRFCPIQPTSSSYGVPPVVIDEDPRPRLNGQRPPVFGYYPPSQRVMPRVSRKSKIHQGKTESNSLPKNAHIQKNIHSLSLNSECQLFKTTVKNMTRNLTCHFSPPI